MNSQKFLRARITQQINNNIDLSSVTGAEVELIIDNANSIFKRGYYYKKQLIALSEQDKAINFATLKRVNIAIEILYKYSELMQAISFDCDFWEDDLIKIEKYLFTMNL